jgi:hypothetical protein
MLPLRVKQGLYPPVIDLNMKAMLAAMQDWLQLVLVVLVRLPMEHMSMDRTGRKTSSTAERLAYPVVILNQ